MGKRSKEKGKRGERELAQFLTERGFPAQRGVQYSGHGNSPDVVCEALSGTWIEVKRVERLNLYDAFAQAQHDANFDQIPVVFHRRNGKDWLISMSADDFLKSLKGEISFNDT